MDLDEATKLNNERRLTQAPVFIEWRDLPPEMRKHLDALESFVGDVDGKTIATEAGENTFIDEGTVDASDAVNAINALVVAIRNARP